MAPRQDLISSAVNFLQDPSVASSPTEKRIEFLRSKNLTEEEIEVALAQASGDSQVLPSTAQNYQNQPYQRPPPGYNYGYPPPGAWQQPPPEPPRRDWRDWFIMATVVGGASYGLYTLAQRYVRPLIAPPTAPQLEQDKAAIDEQFNRAFALLDTLSEDTNKLKEAEEQRTQRLDSVIADVEAVISELKMASLKREEESRTIQADLAQLKDHLPRAIDSVRDTSETQLKDLSTELSSLKALMGNRAGSISNFSASNMARTHKAEPPNFARSSSSVLNSEVAPGSQGNVTGVNGSSTVPFFASSTSTGPVASMASKPSTSLGYGSGKVSIPAWQLAAQGKKEGTDGADGTTTPPGDGADAVAALKSA